MQAKEIKRSDNFFTSIFGSIFRGANIPVDSGKSFMPVDSKGGIMYLNGDVSWLGLNTRQMQYWAYQYCSPLASVIDRLAEADINGNMRIVNKKGEDAGGYDTKKVKNLLLRPNPLQTWHNFRAQQVTIKKIFGFCPVWVMKPAGMNAYDAKMMWNLNPFYWKPERNESFTLYNGQKKIKSWNCFMFNSQYTVTSDEVLILEDGFLDHDELGLPLSKIVGLEYAISNICAAMEADNVLLKKKGPLGFLSFNPPNDQFTGYKPMTPDDKKDAQEELQRYGLSWDKWQYAVMKQAMRWNPMSFNLRDLMTKETCREGIDSICDRFSYPAELMSGKNATYENRRSAETFLYDTIVIPSNMRDMMQYDYFFYLDDTIQSDYSKLPILQEDVVKQAEANKYNAESFEKLFLNKVIHLNQYRQKMNIEVVEGDDVYYGTPDYETKYPTQNKVNPSPSPLKVAV